MTTHVATQFRTDLTAVSKSSPETFDFIWYVKDITVNNDALSDKFFFYRNGNKIPIQQVGDSSSTTWRTSSDFNIVDVLFDDQENDDNEDFYESYLANYQAITLTSPVNDISVNITDSNPNEFIKLKNEFDGNDKDKPLTSYFEFDLSNLDTLKNTNVSYSFSVNLKTFLNYLPRSNVDVSNDIVVNFNYRGMTNIAANEILTVRTDPNTPTSDKYVDISLNLMSFNSTIEFLTDFTKNETDLTNNDGILPSVYFSTLVDSSYDLNLDASTNSHAYNKRIPISIPYVEEVVGLGAGSWNWIVKLTDNVGDPAEQFVQTLPLTLEVIPNFSKIDISFGGSNLYDSNDGTISFSGDSGSSITATLSYNVNDRSNTDLMEWARFLELTGKIALDDGNGNYTDVDPSLTYISFTSNDVSLNPLDSDVNNNNGSVSITLEYNGDDHLIDASNKDNYVLRIGQKINDENSYNTFTDFPLRFTVPYDNKLLFVNNYDGTYDVSFNETLEPGHRIELFGVDDENVTINIPDNGSNNRIFQSLNNGTTTDYTFDLSANAYYIAKIINSDNDVYESVSTNPLTVVEQISPSLTLDVSGNDILSTDITNNFGPIGDFGTNGYKWDDFGTLDTWVSGTYDISIGISYELPHGVVDDNVSLEIRAFKVLKSSNDSHTFDISLSVFDGSNNVTDYLTTDENVNAGEDQGIYTLSDVSKDEDYSLFIECPENRDYGIEYYVDVRLIKKAGTSLTGLSDGHVFARTTWGTYIRPTTDDYTGGKEIKLYVPHSNTFIFNTSGSVITNQIIGGNISAHQINKADVENKIKVNLGHFDISGNDQIFNDNNDFTFDSIVENSVALKLFDGNPDTPLPNIVDNSFTLPIDRIVEFDYYVKKNGVLIESPNTLILNSSDNPSTTSITMNYESNTSSDNDLAYGGYNFDISSTDLSDLDNNIITIESDVDNFDISLTYSLANIITNSYNNRNAGIVVFIDKENIGTFGDDDYQMDISLTETGTGEVQNLSIIPPQTDLSLNNIVYAINGEGMTYVDISNNLSSNVDSYKLSISLPQTRNRGVNYTVKVAIADTTLFPNFYNSFYDIFYADGNTLDYSCFYAVSMMKFFVRPNTETYTSTISNTVLTYNNRDVYFSSDTTSLLTAITETYDENLDFITDSSYNYINLEDTSLNLNVTTKDQFFEFDNHEIDSSSINMSVTYKPYFKYDASGNVLINNHIRLLNKDANNYTLEIKGDVALKKTNGLDSTESITDSNSFVKIKDISKSILSLDEKDLNSYYDVTFKVNSLLEFDQVTIGSTHYRIAYDNTTYAHGFEDGYVYIDSTNFDSTLHLHSGSYYPKTDYNITAPSLTNGNSNLLLNKINLPDNFYGIVDISFNTIHNDIVSKHKSYLRIACMLPVTSEYNNISFDFSSSFNGSRTLNSSSFENNGSDMDLTAFKSSVPFTGLERIVVDHDVSGNTVIGTLYVSHPSKYIGSKINYRITEEHTDNNNNGGETYTETHKPADIYNTSFDMEYHSKVTFTNYNINGNNTANITFNMRISRDKAFDSVYYFELFYDDGFSEKTLARTAFKLYVRPTVLDYVGGHNTTLYVYNGKTIGKRMNLNATNNDNDFKSVTQNVNDFFSGQYDFSSIDSINSILDTGAGSYYSLFKTGDGDININLGSSEFNGNFTGHTLVGTDSIGQSSGPTYATVLYDIKNDNEVSHGNTINGKTGNTPFMTLENSGNRLNSLMLLSFRTVKDNIRDENLNNVIIISIDEPDNTMFKMELYYNTANTNLYNADFSQETFGIDISTNYAAVVNEIENKITGDIPELTINGGENSLIDKIDISYNITSNWYFDPTKLKIRHNIIDTPDGSTDDTSFSSIVFTVNGSSEVVNSNLLNNAYDITSHDVPHRLDIFFKGTRERNANNVDVFYTIEYHDGTNVFNMVSSLVRYYVRPSHKYWLGDNQVIFAVYSNSTITFDSTNAKEPFISDNNYEFPHYDNGHDYLTTLPVTTNDESRGYYYTVANTNSPALFNLNLAGILNFSDASILDHVETPTLDKTSVVLTDGYDKSSALSPPDGTDLTNLAPMTGSGSIILGSCYGYVDLEYKILLNSVLSEKTIKLRLLVIPRPIADNSQNFFGELSLTNNSITIDSSNSSINTNNGFIERTGSLKGDEYLKTKTLLNDKSVSDINTLSNNMQYPTFYSGDTTTDISLNFSKGQWLNSLTTINDIMKIHFTWQHVDYNSSTPNGNYGGDNSFSNITYYDQSNVIKGTIEKVEDNLTLIDIINGYIKINFPSGNDRPGGTNYLIKANVILDMGSELYNYVVASTKFKLFIRPGTETYTRTYTNELLINNCLNLRFHLRSGTLSQGEFFKGNDYLNNMKLAKNSNCDIKLDKTVFVTDSLGNEATSVYNFSTIEEITEIDDYNNNISSNNSKFSDNVTIKNYSGSQKLSGDITPDDGSADYLGLSIGYFAGIINIKYKMKISVDSLEMENDNILKIYVIPRPTVNYRIQQLYYNTVVWGRPFYINHSVTNIQTNSNGDNVYNPFTSPTSTISNNSYLVTALNSATQLYFHGNDGTNSNGYDIRFENNINGSVTAVDSLLTSYVDNSNASDLMDPSTYQGTGSNRFINYGSSKSGSYKFEPVDLNTNDSHNVEYTGHISYGKVYKIVYDGSETIHRTNPAGENNSGILAKYNDKSQTDVNTTYNSLLFNGLVGSSSFDIVFVNDGDNVFEEHYFTKSLYLENKLSSHGLNLIKYVETSSNIDLTQSTNIGLYNCIVVIENIGYSNVVINFYTTGYTTDTTTSESSHLSTLKTDITTSVTLKKYERATLIRSFSSADTSSDIHVCFALIGKESNLNANNDLTNPP